MNKSRFIISLGTSAYFIYYAVTYTEWHFIDNVNLIIHEAGHMIFMFFGTFINILGGTLLQILIPVIFTLYFYFRQEYFSASLLLFWVGQNFLNVSVYASDAIRMELPLLGGDSAGHDWNNMLSMLGILKHTYTIGRAFFIIGLIIILIAACFSIYNSFKTNGSTGVEPLR